MNTKKTINKIHVKTGDTVMIMSGKAKGRKGKVLAVSPAEGKVIVEKCNMVTKHVKPKKQGDPSGIIKAEGAMYSSKVQPYCNKCKMPTRIKKKIENNGEKIRICAKCSAEL